MARAGNPRLPTEITGDDRPREYERDTEAEV
jgi:hypothetical protein